ncbi:MAG: hypothetical protein ABIG39_02355 [Candidatus Micrarchaeota archaeon]
MDMTPVEVHKKLIELGVSDLDAGLVVNCIDKRSTYTWMNTDHITQGHIRTVNDFLLKNDVGIRVELCEVPYRGKYIWEVKAESKPQQEERRECVDNDEAPHKDEASKDKAPHGRFKTLSELGL